MTDKIDTSREAVERLARYADHEVICVGLAKDAAAMMRALVAERDEARAQITDLEAQIRGAIFDCGCREQERDEARAEIERLTVLCNDQASDWAPRAGRTEIAEAEATVLRALVVRKDVALDPFAAIALARESDPTAPDMIDGPDLIITARDVRRARKVLALTPADLAGCVVVKREEAAVGQEIISIMECYDEQMAKRGYVDTPGGLEHMGDVWTLLDRWRAMLAGGRNG